MGETVKTVYQGEKDISTVDRTGVGRYVVYVVLSERDIDGREKTERDRGERLVNT
jgi:hypothetical protein